MRTIQCILGALAVFVILGAALAPRASATVMDYHDFVQSYADTLVQYDFDGATVAERLEDKKGTNDLTKSGSGTVTYDVTGYDGTSDAFTPDYAVTTALLTSSNINLPASGTSFEAIFKPKSISGTVGYIAAAYDGSNRSYFATTSSDKLTVRAGGGSFSTTSYTPGEWYYMATTMAYDSTSTTTTAHVYVADLSSEDPTLATYSETMPGTFSIDLQHGIGALWYQSKLQWAFDGDIDEVAFYSGVKDQDFFQANLDRIVTVPEPSSLLLALLAASGLGVTLRWRPATKPAKDRTMKTTGFRLGTWISLALVGGLLPTVVQAAVMPVTAVTIAEHPTLTTGEILTGLTADGVTYTNLIGGTALNVSGGGAVFYSSAEATADRATLLSGLSITTGIANVPSVDVTFGTQVFILGDDSRFFMFDIYGGDSASVQLLDNGGNPIADYSLTTGSGYGVSVDPSDTVLVNGGNEEAGYNIKGLIFDLEDFTYTGTGTDPGMPDVYGLRFTGSGWDPALFGATVVPEPPSVLLLLMALGALGLTIRRYR